MLIQVGLCSIISPTQASKALLFARVAATVDANVPIEVPLTSVRLKYKWFVQPKLHQEISFWHPLPCHVLFQHGWGDCIFVYLDVFQYSTSKKDLDATCCLSALCLFLSHVLLREVDVLCIKLAYLFLRICWMKSSRHLPQFDGEVLD